MEDYIPEVDTSYGLIYRLNYLWARADRESLGGDLDKWELVLDRIFSNLLYRNEIEIQENKEGEIVNLKFSDKDAQVQDKLKEDIKEVKKKKFEACKNKNREEYFKARGEHYKTIMMYDIWLRKFMHQSLKLYMKESETNPSMALFGGTKKRRR